MCELLASALPVCARLSLETKIRLLEQVRLLPQSSDQGCALLRELADCVDAKPFYSDDERFVLAARYGRLQLLEMLLARGVDVQSEGNQALKGALEGDHVEVVRWLVQRGADPTALDEIAHEKYRNLAS